MENPHISGCAPSHGRGQNDPSHLLNFRIAATLVMGKLPAPLLQMSSENESSRSIELLVFYSLFLERQKSSQFLMGPSQPQQNTNAGVSSSMLRSDYYNDAKGCSFLREHGSRLRRSDRQGGASCADHGFPI